MNEEGIEQNALTPPPTSRTLWSNPYVQGALLALLMGFAGLYYQFAPGFVVDNAGNSELRSTSVGLAGADGYYHIKMAYLYRTGEVGAAGAKFHWTRESTWNGSFSDKDFLFHIYLIPFTLCADGPGDADFADQWLSFTGKDDMLMFGSSYPHWHCGDARELPAAWTAEQREKVCWRNAAGLYGIDIPAGVAAR